MNKKALAVRHVAFEDLGLIAPLLQGRGYDVEYLEAGVDPITPQVLGQPDLVVVLGGPVGVYEESEYPVLADEVVSIRSRLVENKPTLGVCLGAQMMARALGAEVRSTGKKEIGYGVLSLTNEGKESVLAPLDGMPVLHWHGDEFLIPDGAERLAETPGFPNQAFQLGPNALGLQFHLEADHRQVERWLIGHANELASAGIDPATIRVAATEFGPALESVAIEVISGWLDQLRGSA